MKRKIKRRQDLGQFLVDQKVISQKQLKKARMTGHRLTKIPKRTVYETLIVWRWITPAQLEHYQKLYRASL